MKRKIWPLILVSVLALFLTACSKNEDLVIPGDSTVNEDIDYGNSDNEQTPDLVIPADPGVMEYTTLTPNSQNINFENQISIVFSMDNPPVVTNNMADVAIDAPDGKNIVITSTNSQKINYVLSGISGDGSVKIASTNAFGLILNGVGLTSSNGSAVYIASEVDCEVSIVEGTNNRLIDGGSGEKKAAIFASGNLKFTGSGMLEMSGMLTHAVNVKGTLCIESGNIVVRSALKNGFSVAKDITISGGSTSIYCTGDAIQNEADKSGNVYPINITGGELTITTTGQKGHAIKSDGDLTINTAGTILITTYGAASKGLKPTGNLTIDKGDITINSAGDAFWDETETEEDKISSPAGVKCDGNFIMNGGSLTTLSTGKGGKGINAEGTIVINDGSVITSTTTGAQYTYGSYDTAAKAIKSDGDLTINGGKIRILTKQTEAEGLESKSRLYIKGGDISINAYDDGINASSHIEISGGKIFVYSQTNDGIDSNGTLTISGGIIVSVGSTSPEEGFDCDQNTFKITGGTLVGIGGGTSNPTANVSTQRSLIFNTTGGNTQIVRVEATSTGKEVLTFAMPRTYAGNMTLLFNSDLLKADTGYTIYTGGTISGGSSFHGLCSGAAYTKGTSAGSFTAGIAAGSVSTVGNTSGPGGGGRP